MRRTTHFLAALYTVLALGLLRCALVSYQADAWGYTAFFTAASIGSALAIVHGSWLLDEYRHLLARADADNRAHARANANDDETVRRVLSAACCETWWTSCGFHHDPTCPNDQHRSNA
ncbi:hypothetical protein [Streptomyces cylindrosporus]|uniref:Uncharacterized protein n=1 Tax=Streptomyces cylindrosporus TaxID=2927583 RepID=A0ABS9Y4J5_9ACTN|nr:hypothetical protein [Streptomyces cylindrosporus]MCI3271420.1 hypothetical protein [Streptomyces cylindrosporus]